MSITKVEKDPDSAQEGLPKEKRGILGGENGQRSAGEEASN